MLLILIILEVLSSRSMICIQQLADIIAENLANLNDVDFDSPFIVFLPLKLLRV